VNTLIVKLGATGDVVRTTPLLEKLGGEVIWLTEPKNAILLHGVNENLRCLAWEQREAVPDIAYDLIINLEDTQEIGLYLNGLKAKQRFGAYAAADGRLSYTEDSQCWFDLSLISSHGRERADELKFLNRRTYQDLIFDGLGLQFEGEKYLLPEPIETGLSGDVAIAADSGPVWPMKKWAYFGALKERLENRGLRINVLPKRSSLLEHLADVRNHLCLVGGDSLPMHFALGTGTRCVSLFTCTSPWEIYGYGIQTKIISPLLEEFFYKRGYIERATTAISVDEVFNAVIAQLDAGAAVTDSASAK
jgi:ADP-heptose:LPS heptosyltransferase